jgi:hypothetical protein
MFNLKALVQLGSEKTDGANSLNRMFTEIIESMGIQEGRGPFYTVSSEDWYKTYPYRFKIVNKDKVIYYSLPIPPEALSYQMVSASQLIPTLGGVVEETSPTVFWQIALSGTTGIGISRKYAKDLTTDTLDAPAAGENSFRRVLKGGLLANTFNKAANAFEAAADQGAAGYVGLLEGLASTAQRYNSSAVRSNVPEDGTASKLANIVGVDLSRFSNKTNATNGYVEIHLLHTFLNAYGHLKDNNPEDVKLYFESQKDNMQWQVIIKNFAFQKNANQPYLYKYNIVLQGFDLSEVGKDNRKAVDRFGPNGDLGGVSSFTLSGALQRAKALERKLDAALMGDYGGLISSKPPII